MTMRLAAKVLPLLSLFPLCAAACSGMTSKLAPPGVGDPAKASAMGRAIDGPAAPSIATPPAEVALVPLPAVTSRRLEALRLAPPTAPVNDRAGAIGAIAAGRPEAPPPGHSASAASGAAIGELRAANPWIAQDAVSASIKAGEWDDNANYREFGRWLSTERDTLFHRVDVSERRFLVVRDSAGKGVPRCPVTVVDSAQHRTTLTTNASGRAILFPHAEGLVSRELTATTDCQGSSAQTGFSLDGQDGVVALRMDAARALPSMRTIDVAFVVDTTGSMSEEITAVKSTVEKVASSLARGDLRVRIGMVAYKDRGDEYVTKVYPMTTDLGAFQRDVSQVAASGGGDMPESVNEGIHVALTALDWSRSSLAQFAFLIGDAPPHLDYAQDFDYAAEMKMAAHRGIQIFTVAASGMDDLGQVVWRQVAEYTNATNLFVLRGGAGPQSTGAGDPKASCGGTHGNYTSGQLDTLILGKIRHELAGLDRDPMMIPGLYADENAKPCGERMLATD